MVVDTSAILSILLEERECVNILSILSRQNNLSMSVGTYYEASVVLAGKKKNPIAVQALDALIRDLGFHLIPISVENAKAARDAYFRFGRGYHPAELNLADCFSYVLAKALGEPLLFKGNDFLKTDISPAWTP